MDSIRKRNTAIDEAIQRTRLSRDLMGGTPAMRRGGWIKKGSAENFADYVNRRDSAVLFNGFKRTLGYLAGQVFKKDLEITRESQLYDLFTRMQNDIDLQGNDLRTFAQRFFIMAVHDGAMCLLVQYPTVRMNDAGQYWDDVNEEWVTRTRETDQTQGWRPYFTALNYDKILGARFEYINGVKVLTQLRILETVINKGEFDVDDEEIEQVRLLERGRWSTWRKVGEQGGKETWAMVDEGKTSISDIPLAVFMPGERITEITAIPALEDLAFLNMRHFVASADQQVLMQFVRRPPWFGRALVQEGETVQFGPGRMVHSNDPNAALTSVGIDPSSVEAGRGELKDLEDRMSLYGLMMLMPTLRASGGKTATQAQQESAESVSQLMNWAQSFKDCFDQAFKFAAMYEGIEVGKEPEVKLPVDFQPGMGMEPRTLIEAVEKLILPKQIVFDEFRRRGLVSESYDWEEVLGMMQREAVGPTEMPGQSDDVLDFVRSIAEREATATGQVGPDGEAS